MASEYGLLGADGAVSSKKSSKVVFCIFCAVAAVATLAVIGSLKNSNPEADGMVSGGSGSVALWAGMSSYRPQLRMETGRSVQQKLASYGFGSSPLTNLAVSAIEINNRGTQGRDLSMRAAQEMASGWSEVDEKTKEKLLNAVNQVKEKEAVLAGITAPMGFFDPLGFSTTGTSGGKLLFYREVELKHGRIAMLASLGILVGEQFHPLFGGDIDVPSYLAFQQTPLETFWPAVVAAIAIPEVFSVFSFEDPNLKDGWVIREDHEPGNLGFDPLGLKPTDPKELQEMRTKELNNGRLAMIAAAGMIAQELATGQKLF